MYLLVTLRRHHRLSFIIIVKRLKSFLHTWGHFHDIIYLVFLLFLFLDNAMKRLAFNMRFHFRLASCDPSPPVALCAGRVNPHVLRHQGVCWQTAPTKTLLTQSFLKNKHVSELARIHNASHCWDFSRKVLFGMVLKPHRLQLVLAGWLPMLTGRSLAFPSGAIEAARTPDCSVLSQFCYEYSFISCTILVFCFVLFFLLKQVKIMWVVCFILYYWVPPSKTSQWFQDYLLKEAFNAGFFL